MSKLAIAALAATSLALTACGASSSHASCQDNYQAADYFRKFTGARDAAFAAGKITKDVKEKSELDQLYMKTDPDDLGAICVWADAERKKLGI